MVELWWQLHTLLRKTQTHPVSEAAPHDYLHKQSSCCFLPDLAFFFLFFLSFFFFLWGVGGGGGGIWCFN